MEMMIVGGTFLLELITIGIFLIFSSLNSDASPFFSGKRGFRSCLQDEDCAKTELCSIHTINYETVKRCKRNCNYYYSDGIECVDPDLNYPIECRYDSDCAVGKVCQAYKHKCINACDRLSCGRNSFCKVVYGSHTACRCLEGFVGNPYWKEGCKRK